MATALQKQLALFQTSKSNELDLKAQRAAHSKSLIFDPAVAASQSFEILFPICHRAFMELCALDRRFSQYGSTLFNPQSKGQDRNALTVAQNQDLNVILDGFLDLASASVLLKPAQLAIEWLIRRFRIHELNTEALVMAFLPHHLSPVFVAVLSILPTALPPSLKNLHNYIQAASNPPLTALVQASVTNLSFFSLINRYVLRVCKARCQHHSLLSLWAGILTQRTGRILNSSKSGQRNIQQQRIGDLLSGLLPALDEALALRNVPELTVACHMVILAIVRNADLGDRTLEAIMLTVALNLTTDTCVSALSCLALIMEQQASFVLPQAICKRLYQMERLGSHLERLSEDQNIRPLARGLCFGLMSRIHKQRIPQALRLFEVVANLEALPQNERRALAEGLRTVVEKGRSLTKPRDKAIQTQLDDLERFSAAWENSIKDLVEGTSGQQDNVSKSTLGDETLDTVKQRISLVNAARSNHDLGTSGDESFLTRRTKLPYDTLASAFEAAVATAEHLSEMLDLPILGRHAAESNPLFFSFLARIWCSSRSVEARDVALWIVSEQLKQFQQTPSTFRVVIPYVFVALADKARNVRRSAAEVMTVLSSLSISETEQKLVPETIYGKSSAELKQVSDKDMNDLVKYLQEGALEECVSDATHLIAVLQDLLGPTGSGRRLLRTDQKISIFSSFSSHALLTACTSARLGLVTILNTLEKVGGQPRSHFLLMCLKDYVTEFPEHGVSCSAEGVNLTGMTSEMMKIVPHSDQNALKYLFELATGHADDNKANLQLMAFRRLATLWPRVRPNDQKPLAIDLFHFALSGSSNDLAKVEALNFLKLVRLKAEVIVHIIEETIDVYSGTHSDASVKRRRTDTGPVEAGSKGELPDQALLTNLTLAMELAENIKAEPSRELFQTLFKVLRELQIYNMRTNSELAYLTNLTLSSLSSAMHALKDDAEARNITTQVVRPDLLVDCVRHTSNAQSRNTAFLLLSELSKQSPQVVLHSVMPIFTMMSTTSARASDEFSTYVVDQTIKDVIPALVKKLHEEKKDLVAATAEILLSFAASFDHIASHRRLQLYSLLATSLGAEESLFAIIATLSDRFPSSGEMLKFASLLFCQFGSSVAIFTIRKILDLVQDGLQSSPSLFETLMKQESNAWSRDKSLLNLTNTVSTLLKDQVFQVQLQRDLDLGGDAAARLEQVLRQSFERSNTLSSTAIPELKTAAFRIMQQILTLFPLDAMVRSIEPFIEHSDDALCRRVLVTLEKRIESSPRADHQTRSDLISLLPRLTPILQTTSRPELKPNALACIDQLCEKFGKIDKSAVLDAAQVVGSKSCLGSEDLRLRALSFHFLSSAIEILQGDFISIMKNGEDAACDSLQTAISAKQESLHNGIFAFLISLVEHLAFVVSEDFFGAIMRITEECTLLKFGKEASDMRYQFYKLSGTKLAVSTLSTVTRSHWAVALQKGPLVMGEYIQLLKFLVETRPRSEVAHSSAELFSVFVEALDSRRIASLRADLYSTEEVELLERAVVEVLNIMVLKVNDSIFRPFFVRLVGWSFNPPAQHNKPTYSARVITLFNLTLSLSERLKSIFTSYFGCVMDQAIQILQDDASSPNLRKSVLKALQSSFRHDQDADGQADFWQSPSHFGGILEPLVMQFTRSSMRALYPEAASAVQELAKAASSSEHHKSTNSLLLKMCRSESSQVRLATVKCQRSLTEDLGDEWLSNLPEMLPVINELQEDDDEAVEAETHKWIKSIEGKLGESLNEMLQ